jgi:hypothetical protein
MQIGSIDSARDRDALLLAARQLARKLVRVRLQADALEQLQALVGRLVLAAAEHLDLRDGQVLGDRQVREQLEVLEHHPDLRAQLRQVGLRVADRLPFTRISPCWNGSRPLTS